MSVAANYCTDCRAALHRHGLCDPCKTGRARIVAARKSARPRREHHPAAIDPAKLRVPEPLPALFDAALRVATGKGTTADAAEVTAAVPGYDAEFAARVTMLRWYFHDAGKGWYK